MNDVKRPSFNDTNETVSDPIHSGVDGHSGPEPVDDANVTSTPSSGERCDKSPAGWTCTRAIGHEGPCAAVPDELPAETEAVTQGALALFELTKRRMVILLGTLVQLAENGDFALWAPLGAMDEQFRALDWTSVPPLAVAKFHKLISMTLTTYAAKMDAHAMAVLESMKTPGAPLPPLPAWTGEDTLQMYDMVASIFAPADETPAAVPAVQEASDEPSL